MKMSCIGLITVLGAFLLTGCSEERKDSRSALDRRAVHDSSAAADKYEQREAKQFSVDVSEPASTDIGPGPLGAPYAGAGFGGIGGPGFGGPGYGGFGPGFGIGDPALIGDPFGLGLFLPPPPPFFPIDDFGDDDGHRHDDDDDNCQHCTDVCCDGDRLSLSGEGASASFDGDDQSSPSGQLEIGFERPLNLLVESCGEISGNINTRGTFLTTPEDPNCNGTIADPDCTPQTVRRFDNLACLEVEDNTAWFVGLVYAEDPDPRFIDEQNAQVQQSIANGEWAELGRIADIEGGDVRSPFAGVDLVLQEGQDNAIAEIGGIGSFTRVSDNAFSAEELCTLRDEMFQLADFEVQCITDTPGVCPTNPAFMECELPTIAADGIGFADDGSFECWVNSTQLEWLDGETGNPTGIVVPNTVAEISNPPTAAFYSVAGEDFDRDITSGNFVVESTEPERRCDRDDN